MGGSLVMTGSSVLMVSLPLQAPASLDDEEREMRSEAKEGTGDAARPGGESLDEDAMEAWTGPASP